MSYEPSILFLGLSFLVALVSSSVGTLVGGTSLVTIPSLMILGLPSNVAIATNRLGILGLNIAGWYKFHNLNLVNYQIGIPNGLACLAGSLIGAILLVEIDLILLRTIIRALMLIVLPAVIFSKISGLNPMIVLHQRIP